MVSDRSNGRENYFETLTRVGRDVDGVLLRFFDQDKFGESKRIMYEPFLKRKWGGQKLRASLTYLSYCAFTGRNPEEPIEDENLLRLMASTELELWSEYSVNWFFDNKGRVREDPTTRRRAAVSTKSFLEDAVRIAGLVGKDFSDLILDTSGHVTTSFTKELIMDMSNEKLLNGSMREYMDLYRRDYVVPGIGRTLSLGGDLAAIYSGHVDSRRANGLHGIFLDFGIELEILNDLGDFCLSGTSTDKVSQDQFSDIRNGAITPPIWMMYRGAGEEDRRFILDCVGKVTLTQEEEGRLIEILFNSGGYDSISKGLKRSGRKLKRSVRNLGFCNEGGRQLQQAVTILESSKIYHMLRENYFDVIGRDWGSNGDNRKELSIQYERYLKGGLK